MFRLHRLEIEQGNIITPAMMESVHKGMSEAQVRDVLGNPLLINIFSPGRIDYVYTWQKGNDPRLERRISCEFVKGRLTDIQKY